MERVIPTHVTAATIGALRHPVEGWPCEDDLLEAIAWIGRRVMPIEDALSKAESAELDVTHARECLGMAGDSYGYGYIYGNGGCDSSSGYGHGYDDGFGFGHGYGYIHGNGSGDGTNRYRSNGDGSGGGGDGFSDNGHGFGDAA